VSSDPVISAEFLTVSVERVSSETFQPRWPLSRKSLDKQPVLSLVEIILTHTALTALRLSVQILRLFRRLRQEPRPHGVLHDWLHPSVSQALATVIASGLASGPIKDTTVFGVFEGARLPHQR
jgi:hypothetical protein